MPSRRTWRYAERALSFVIPYAPPSGTRPVSNMRPPGDPPRPSKALFCGTTPLSRVNCGQWPLPAHWLMPVYARGRIPLRHRIRHSMGLLFSMRFSNVFCLKVDVRLCAIVHAVEGRFRFVCFPVDVSACYGDYVNCSLYCVLHLGSRVWLIFNFIFDVILLYEYLFRFWWNLSCDSIFFSD